MIGLEIILAGEAGFCFGVRRAIDIAANSVQRHKNFYTLGPLIHNNQVVESLAAKGLRPVDSLDAIKAGAGVVLRSHGASPELMEQARQNGLQIIDATCPFVERAQRLARSLYDEGYQVIIAGDQEHPEVEALVAWAGNQAIVVASPEQAAALPPLERAAVIAQTTQKEDNFAAVVEALRAKSKHLVVHNTICNATRFRQQAAAELAAQSDLTIVVGGKHSSNTRKLAEICAAAGKPTYHVEHAGELRPWWFQGIGKAGVTAGASTPDWIIEEVMVKMMEMDQEQIQKAEEQADQEEKAAEDSHFEVEAETSPAAPVLTEEAATQGSEAIQEEQMEVEQHLDANLKKLRRGDTISGTVVRVSDNEVFVDIGGKSEGIIPISELSTRNVSDPTEVIKEGDSVEVFVLRMENEEGHPVLSKRRADRKKAWEVLEAAQQESRELEAEVIEVVKGGLLVDVGVRGFVPASLVERGYVANLEEYLGRNLHLKIIELDRGKNKVVLSRKAVLDAEYEQKRQETWDNLEKGQVVQGVVRRLTNFGAFVDLGGVDGLLHVSEINWGRVDHPADVLAEGQEIEVMVLGVDREGGKVSLGLKQLHPNPWQTAAERYSVGSVVTGKILRIAPFGAFVEVEPGIEGLVHISQLSDQHVEKTEDAVNIGEEVPVKILSVDQEAQRMSLSIRQAAKKEERRTEGKERKAKTEPLPREYEEESGLTLGDLFGDKLKEEIK